MLVTGRLTMTHDFLRGMALVAAVYSLLALATVLSLVM